MTKREALEEQLVILEELAYRKAANDFKTFVPLMKADYIMEWFHEYAANKLNEFAKGNIKNIMFLMPPQHGKSELASRLFPAFMLGLDRNKRIGLVTYNDTFAKKFNKHIQRYIDTPQYRRVFPNTTLSGFKGVEANHSNYSRNANEIEVVNATGGLITVGRDGQINGLPMDMLIIDDLYKNREEAVSPTISEKIWTNYTEVFDTRLHNGSQKLIMNTRWDDTDLAGRLLALEPDKWEIIKFPAIKEKGTVDYDPRNEGEALFPVKHSLERLLSIKETNPVTFNSLYQQDPRPSQEVLCIRRDWQEIEVIPYDKCDKIMFGIDWGWANDPTVVAKVGVNLKDRELYLDEIMYKPLGYNEGKTGGNNSALEEMVLAIMANGYNKGQYVCADRSPSDMAYLSSRGIYCDPAHKPEGCVPARINIMNSFKIFITRRSVNAKREANNYQWVVAGGKITNEPVDKFNHFWDAVGYPVHKKLYNV